MDITLSREMEALVKSKVESGFYPSAGDVIEEGLRLLLEQDSVDETDLEKLRFGVAVGFRQIERGAYTEYRSPEEFETRVKIEMRRRYARETQSK